jgi:hypothetical protein
VAYFQRLYIQYVHLQFLTHSIRDCWINALLNVTQCQLSWNLWKPEKDVPICKPSQIKHYIETLGDFRIFSREAVKDLTSFPFNASHEMVHVYNTCNVFGHKNDVSTMPPVIELSLKKYYLLGIFRQKVHIHIPDQH